MGKISTEEILPRRLPSGFRYRHRLDGITAAGFAGLMDQVALVHTKGIRQHDLAYPMTVHVVDDPAVELIATERRPGVSVDIAVADASAVYHDGWWTAPPDGESIPSWGTGAMHSLTVHTAIRTYAVRAAREVPLDDLILVVRSSMRR